VGKRITVLVDSGFRRGSDVVKALALGAHGVQIGRATLYGIATAGFDGAQRALEILREEIDRVMALLGCRSVAELGPEALHFVDNLTRQTSHGKPDLKLLDREKMAAEH